MWAASGLLAVVLFAAGLLFGDILASANYPPLDASHARLEAYFSDNPGDVRALGFFHLLSAIALAAYTAYLAGLLRQQADRRGRLAFLAITGGVTAAVMLLLSAITYRLLAEPDITRDVTLTHALVVLSYLTGGPAVSLPLGLVMVAVVIATMRDNILPRWTGWLGIAGAAASFASAGTILAPASNSSAAYGVLLLAAVLGFAWLALTSALLACRRGAAP